MLNGALHLDLDAAWRDEPLHLPIVDAQKWGPRLRFSAPPRLVEQFYNEFESRLPAFVLYGSGDFHYLSALWLRRVTTPVVLVSFDNHPDWDVRPPRWGCGGWINRAVELPMVRHIEVWGCGNFECWWPHNLFGNHRAERKGKLKVHPWADDRPAKDRERLGAILRENWRDQFDTFASNLNGVDVYVTVDLDCFRIEDAITNWENGFFDAGDVEWAIKKLRQNGRIVAGDVCGAFSQPQYARWKQRVAGNWDHPKIAAPDSGTVRKVNFATLERIWPALTH